MVHDIISNILVLVEIATLGFTTFLGLLALLKPDGTWPYRIVSSFIMLSFGVIPLSMLIWPDLFAGIANMQTGPLPTGALDYNN